MVCWTVARDAAARTNRGRKAMALDEFARIAAYLAPLSAGHAGAGCVTTPPCFPATPPATAW